MKTTYKKQGIAKVRKLAEQLGIVALGLSDEEIRKHVNDALMQTFRK